MFLGDEVWHGRSRSRVLYFDSADVAFGKFFVWALLAKGDHKQHSSSWCCFKPCCYGSIRLHLWFSHSWNGREGEIKRGDGSRLARVKTKIVHESRIASPSRVFCVCGNLSVSQVQFANYSPHLCYLMYRVIISEVNKKSGLLNPSGKHSWSVPQWGEWSCQGSVHSAATIILILIPGTSVQEEFCDMVCCCVYARGCLRGCVRHPHASWGHRAVWV